MTEMSRHLFHGDQNIEYTSIGTASVALRAVCAMGGIYDNTALPSTRDVNNYLFQHDPFLDGNAGDVPPTPIMGDDTLNYLGASACTAASQSTGANKDTSLPLMADHLIDIDDQSVRGRVQALYSSLEDLLEDHTLGRYDEFVPLVKL